MINIGQELVLDILSLPWAVQTSITTRSTEFASKKEGNNVMVIGMTYEFYFYLKSSLIPTSASSFLYHDYILISFIIEARMFSLLWALSRCSEVYKEDHFQINAYPESSGSSIRGVTSIAINKSYWWEPWWVVSRTASWTQHKSDSWKH